MRCLARRPIPGRRTARRAAQLATPWAMCLQVPGLWCVNARLMIPTGRLPRRPRWRTRMVLPGRKPVVEVDFLPFRMARVLQRIEVIADGLS